MPAILEMIQRRAERLAARRNISVAEAYQLVLRSNPLLYELSQEEKANAGPVGTSGSLRYAQAAARAGKIHR